MTADRRHWTRFAAEWIDWARTPGHDAFWSYRRSLIEFIGRGEGDALDVGCGEGRVSRELSALGYRVTALDVAERLVDAAAEARSAQAYVVADAASLPFEDRRFKLITAYNVLMDLEDVTAAVKEMSRVLSADANSSFPSSTRSGIGASLRATIPMRLSSFAGPISAGRGLKGSRSAMDCGCIMPAGLNRSNPTLRLSARRDWRSHAQRASAGRGDPR